jgi:hypothetical protein
MIGKADDVNPSLPSFGLNFGPKINKIKNEILRLPSKMSFLRKQESRVPGENRDPVFKIVPGFRRDDVWIPGRVSLARNDDSAFPEL